MDFLADFLIHALVWTTGGFFMAFGAWMGWWAGEYVFDRL